MRKMVKSALFFVVLGMAVAFMAGCNSIIAQDDEIKIEGIGKVWKPTKEEADKEGSKFLHKAMRKQFPELDLKEDMMETVMYDSKLHPYRIRKNEKTGIDEAVWPLEVKIRMQAPASNGKMFAATMDVTLHFYQNEVGKKYCDYYVTNVTSDGFIN